jgi:hypothetical protein
VGRYAPLDQALSGIGFLARVSTMWHVLVRAKVHWYKVCRLAPLLVPSYVLALLAETATSMAMGVICLFPLSKEFAPCWKGSGKIE